MQGAFINGQFITPAGIQDRPFLAEYEQITLKKLPGGKTSQQIRRGAIYRAANGRSRREEYAMGEENVRARVVIIHDPIKQVGYLLDIDNKSVFTMPLPSSESQPQSPIFTGENIGEKVFEEMRCRGYRRNDRERGDIEYWVSEDLLEVVLAKSIFKEEESTLRLFNIRRVEPDRNLFSVPEDYEAVTIE
jgi:hypothetical protein